VYPSTLAICIKVLVKMFTKLPNEITANIPEKVTFNSNIVAVQIVLVITSLSACPISVFIISNLKLVVLYMPRA